MLFPNWSTDISFSHDLHLGEDANAKVELVHSAKSAFQLAIVSCLNLGVIKFGLWLDVLMLLCGVVGVSWG